MLNLFEGYDFKRHLRPTVTNRAASDCLPSVRIKFARVPRNLCRRLLFLSHDAGSNVRGVSVGQVW
jgi:hypothetical protein